MPEQDFSSFTPVWDSDAERVENFRTLAEILPDIIWTATPEGEVDYINSRWGLFSGIETGDPDYNNWAIRVHPEDLPGAIEIWRGALASGLEYEQQFRLKNKAGAYRWHKARGTAITDASGQILKWYGVTTDIEELKAAELAEKKNSQEKDTFMALLGHELRNPLFVLSSSVELLSADELTPTQRAAVNVQMSRQVRHLKRLVDDVLDISRLSSGKMRLVCEPLDLKEVVRLCVEQAGDIAKTKSIDLAFFPRSEDTFVHGDEVRLSQCVTNLINNALKFTEESGSISLSLEKRGEFVHLDVKDSGIGMSSDELGTVFSAFEQGEMSDSYSAEGLGLGLSIVHELVSMHQGTVTASSPGKGQGTTLSIILPSIVSPESESPTRVESAIGSTSTKRILVVDDNPGITSMMRIFFELEGHEVKTASSGEAALAALQSFSADIIFCDLTMPGVLDGHGVARAVTAADGPSPYLVALSGHAQEQHVKESLASGFHTHIAKPPDLPRLREVIAQL